MSSVWPLRGDVQASAHPAWRQAGPAWLLFTVLVLATMAPTVVSMVEIWWRSGTFNHALGIPPILAWLAWRSRERWLALTPQPDRRWWPLLAALSLVVLLSEAALANAPGHCGLVMILACSVPALLGMQVARALAFPLLFAFFMVPFGEFLMPQMMEATATFTVWALRLTGVPVYRDGLNFVIPSGNWSVVEACSGIRYLMASVCVGSLYAYLNYQSTAKRLWFLAFAALVPIVANWLRAYLIVMLGHLSSNKLAAGADHLVYGWLFFGVVMMLMFWLGARWRNEDEALVRQPCAAGSGQASAAFGAHSPLSESSAPFGWARLLPCIVLACGPMLAGLALQHSAPTPVPLQLPASLKGWGSPQMMEPSTSPWTPRFVAPNAQALAAYSCPGGEEVWVHLAQYWNQSREHKLLSSENVVVTSGDRQWRSAGRGPAVVKVPVAASEINLEPYVLLSRNEGAGGQRDRLLVVQLVRVDGQWMTPGTQARLATMKARLGGRGDHAASLLVATTAPTSSDSSANAQAEQAAVQRMRDFLQAAWPGLNRP